MKKLSYEIPVSTNNQYDIVDITDKVSKKLAETKFSNGFVIITSKHTTAGIAVNESCERLREDVINFLSSLVMNFKPTHDHSTIDGRGNGRAHILAHFLSHSEIITFDNSKLNLGTWQSIFFIELDGSRNRNVEVTFIGD